MREYSRFLRHACLLCAFACFWSYSGSASGACTLYSGVTGAVKLRAQECTCSDAVTHDDATLLALNISAQVKQYIDTVLSLQVRIVAA